MRWLRDQLIPLVMKLAWPVLILVALLAFRPQIVDLLSTRSLKVGAGGVEIGAPAQASQPSAASQVVAASHSEPFPPEYKPLAAVMDKIVEASVPPVMGQQEISRDAALKYLAITNMGAKLIQRASRFIFGSQVDALTLIGSKGSVKIDELKDIFTKARDQSPTFYEHYSFEQWMAFLERQLLIERHDDEVKLTAGGQAIIPYMKMQGYLNARPPY